MSHDPGCLFCKIANGEIPSARVLETDRAVAFLDINPVNKGHTLVIPRDHHANLSEVPDDVAADLGGLLPRVCRAVLEVTEADGLNIIANHGEVAGQTIHHLHWHVIPRHDGDAVHWPWPHQSYAGDELDRLRQAVTKALSPNALNG